MATRGSSGLIDITTPIRKPECRELLQWEHEWNNQVSSFRAPVERAVATLKTWRILFTVSIHGGCRQAVTGAGSQGFPVRAAWMASMGRMPWLRLVAR